MMEVQVEDLAIIGNTMREELHTVIARAEFTAFFRHMMIYWNVTSLG